MIIIVIITIVMCGVRGLPAQVQGEPRTKRMETFSFGDTYYGNGRGLSSEYQSPKQTQKYQSPKPRSGGTTCLTLLVQHTLSSKVANTMCIYIYIYRERERYIHAHTYT